MSTNSKFYDAGIKTLNEAVSADEEKKYARALTLYVQGIEHIQTGIKYDKNEASKKNMLKCLGLYLKRAEDVKIKASQAPPPTSSAAGPFRPHGNGSSSKSSENGGSINAADVDGLFLKQTPTETWSDVVGLETVKRCLQKTVMIPMELPHLFGNGKPLQTCGGVLLYGPPGTGKTLLVKALANESKSQVMIVSLADIFKKFVGESEQSIQKIFQVARTAKNSCVIFFDEVEQLGKERSADTSECSGRSLTQLLTSMDGIQPDSSTDDARILVVGATNFPWLIDPALLRRFTRRFYVPLPSVAARVGIFTRHIERFRKVGGQIQLSLTEIAFLANCTEGYSSADISTAFSIATDGLLDKLLDATHFRQITSDECWVPCSPGAAGAQERSWASIPKPQRPKIQLSDITFTDMQRVIKISKSSVAPGSIEQYEKFTTDCGMDA